jgi:hypothetical protein
MIALNLNLALTLSLTLTLTLTLTLIDIKDDNGGLLTLEEINQRSVITSKMIALWMFLTYIIVGISFYTYAEGKG